MQSYSMSGYLNAVLRRSNKTLLVEGVTDQSVIARLKMVKGERLARDPEGEVDVAELISDPKTAGLGKKQVLHLVMNEIGQLRPDLANKIRLKLGILSDREWDGLALDMQLGIDWCAPEQKNPYFVTVGHSVENYFFRLDAIEAYLRQVFFRKLNQDFFNELSLRFHKIIALATIYSLALRRLGAISRGAGLIDRSMVQWTEGKYLINDLIVKNMLIRHVQPGNDCVSLINSNIDLYLSSHQSPEPGRWLCHGHLGEEAIWACIGNLAVEFRVNDEIAREIERGYKEVKFNHAVDYLARNTLTESGPLDVAVDWLTTP